MLRVTLEQDPRRELCMPFGYEVAVPMHFGAIVDPAQMVNFSSPPMGLAAQRIEYWLKWDDEDMRVVLMPEPVAIHYFGDPRASSNDNPLVRDKRLPEFNQERMRVARVWGDFLYSDMHGPYSTVRIEVPDVPVVSVVAITQSGAVAADAVVYRPHDFFNFASMLSADAEAELAARAARRPKYAQPTAPTIDIANLSPDQIAALAEQLAKFSATRNYERNLEEQRAKKEARINGG